MVGFAESLKLEGGHLALFFPPVLPLVEPWRNVTGKGYLDILPLVMVVPELS